MFSAADMSKFVSVRSFSRGRQRLMQDAHRLQSQRQARDLEDRRSPAATIWHNR